MSVTLIDIPAYSTLSPKALFNRGKATWRDRFPFNSETGRWTFSGRVALYHGLPTLDLPPGSTILVPTYFHSVEIQTLLEAGYDLRFYRLNQDFSVDLEHVRKQIDQTVSAFYIIHYFGFPQPLTEIVRLCRETGLKLIEDCALSLFSSCGETPLGSSGDMALYCIYKTLPLPHGGFLVTRRASNSKLTPAPHMSTLVQTKDLLQKHLDTGSFSWVNSAVTGCSSRLKRLTRFERRKTVSSGGTGWDARLLQYGCSPWVNRLMAPIDPGDVIARRRSNFMTMLSHLQGKAQPVLTDLPDGVCPLFFPVMVENRKQVRERLAGKGIGSVLYWSHSHPSCPMDLAAEVAPWREKILELPIHQGLTSEQVERIAKTLLEVI
jgi:dTDP-4-amino-4,6-dideoxygalactose transaminase